MENRVFLFQETPGGPVKLNSKPLTVPAIPRIDESFVYDKNRYKVGIVIHDFDSGITGVVGRIQSI